MKCCAGELVGDREVGRRVVGHHALHLDAMRSVEGCSSPDESDSRDGFLIGEHLDICQARGVIDADVHELPADPAGALPWALVSCDAVSGTVADLAELLDVDVDRLARSSAFGSGSVALVAQAGRACLDRSPPRCPRQSRAASPAPSRSAIP